MYRESPIPARAQLAEHENAVVNDSDSAQLFCTSCQRNQELVCQILAAYLPDEGDAEYQAQFDRADEYAASLRRRYPVVCRACQGGVDRRLQQQAQWMYRRELASALHRSERVRKSAPRIRPQPTLRRKRLAAMWCLCALAALVACPVAAWGLYLGPLLGGFLAPGERVVGVGLVLALLTYASRMLNPLWLYIASSPGLRAAGLPLYKQRVAYLALLRLLAAVLQSREWHPALWVGVLACDLALTAWAASCLRTLDSRRPASRISRHGSTAARAAGTDGSRHASPPNAVTERDTQQALVSLKGLSFGASESNMDQDDSLLGSAFSSATGNPWGRRPSSAVRRGTRRRAGADSSDEDATVSGDVLADLNTLSFGAPVQGSASLRAGASRVDDELAALLGGGGGGSSISGSMGSFGRNSAWGRGSNNNSNSSMLGKARASGAAAGEPRPFEAFAFNRSVDTGLESKMSAFTLDDGSYQGVFGSSAMDSRLLSGFQRALSPGAAVGACVAGSWAFGAYVPLPAVWLVRLALIGAVVATVAALPRRALPAASAAAARLGGCAVLVALVCVPLWITGRAPGSADYVPDPRMLPDDSAVWGTRLSRWPLAKQQMSRGICSLGLSGESVDEEKRIDDDDWAVAADAVIDTRKTLKVPALLWLDCAAEFSALALLAFT
ncbi:hypothetical protein IWW50_000428 [Coemansia erecta]|nr:hypothetical protein IWW50_000428 [Coemansia erecta]